MYKLIILVTALLFTSFIVRPSDAKAEFPLCEGTQLIVKKMKSGEEQSLKGYEMDDGADVFLSTVDLQEWICMVKENSRAFTFTADKPEDEDTLLVQKQFRDIKAQFIECFHPAKITITSTKSFGFVMGAIRVLVLVNQGFSKDHYVSLNIAKSKK